MLLGPQGFEKVGDPAVDRPQPVQARVARPPEGNQGVRAMGGAAVVDDERRGGLADAAEVMVALEDPFPPAAEAGPRSPAAVVAPLAQPAAVEVRGSAGAAQRQLDLGGGHEERERIFLAREARRRVGRAAKNPAIRRRRRP